MRRTQKCDGGFQPPFRKSAFQILRGKCQGVAASRHNQRTQYSIPHTRRLEVTATNRSGLTLLEVILSTAIFLGALTAILQVMRIGHESRLSARLDAECALRCESMLGQLISGMMPLSSDSGPFEDNENWVYTIEVEDGALTDLLMVSVTVEHMANEQPNAALTLNRLMRDPQLFLDAAMSATETEEE